MTDEKTLDWKLIVSLSLFGFGMALGTVWWIPSKVEPVFWLLVFVTCAVVIARRRRSKYFWHGFLVSLVNCVWVTSAHILFYEAYLANHVEEAAMLKSMPSPDSPRLMMAMMGPAFGVVSGLVLGGFAVVASKVMKRKLA